MPQYSLGSTRRPVCIRLVELVSACLSLSYLFKEVMFLSHFVCWLVCCSACLSVSRITQKIVDELSEIFASGIRNSWWCLVLLPTNSTAKEPLQLTRNDYVLKVEESCQIQLSDTIKREILWIVRNAVRRQRHVQHQLVRRLVVPLLSPHMRQLVIVTPPVSGR